MTRQWLPPADSNKPGEAEAGAVFGRAAFRPGALEHFLGEPYFHTQEKLNAQEAIDRPNFANFNGPSVLEKGVSRRNGSPRLKPWGMSRTSAP